MYKKPYLQGFFCVFEQQKRRNLTYINIFYYQVETFIVCQFEILRTVLITK